ncbi:MAG: hypothetical protein R3F61_05470 [Myxococcota bacterium]
MIAALLLTSAYADLPTSERQRAAVDRCLAHWKEHPFGDAPEFRVLSASVRVFGVGSQETLESATEKPDLVLIEPSVNVLTKTTWKLHNPNGWYCFDTNVGVLSKIVFDADCDANLADSRSGAVVMGDTETNGGVVVLGDIEVRRSCPVKPASPESTEPTKPSDLPAADKAD